MAAAVARPLKQSPNSDVPETTGMCELITIDRLSGFLGKPYLIARFSAAPVLTTMRETSFMSSAVPIEVGPFFLFGLISRNSLEAKY